MFPRSRIDHCLWRGARIFTEGFGNDGQDNTVTTAYDVVAYPSTVHASTHPDRLAVAAHLAGLNPVPMERARVLEIGGGTCLGLLAFATAYPGSHCHGFDLAPSAIAQGQHLVGGDCPNLTLAVDDIMLARGHFAAGSFDYVIAHGVYAWVPEAVRQGLLDLIAHVLSPDGVAFVSYNAMPGGHVRMVLRQTLLHAIAGVEGAEARMEAARQALATYAAPRADDDPLMQGLRDHARRMQDRAMAVVFHDELGECFAPQALSDVVAAAGRVGLRFLTDAGPNRVFDGFLPPDADADIDAENEIVQLGQMRDYMEFCWFRATLLVPAGAAPARRLDAMRSDGLWVSAPMQALDGDEFQIRDDVFHIELPDLAERLRALVAIWPARLPVEEIAPTLAEREVLMRLYRSWSVMLHTGPGPFVTKPGDRPETGVLIRGMLARGEVRVVNLAHRELSIDQSEMRALLQAADGTRLLADLMALDHGIPGDQVEAALRAAAGQALMRG